MSPAPVAVIINPISGTGGRPERARRLAADVTTLLEQRGVEPRLWLTERGGHAAELAAAAARDGFQTVVAWGGDGTVNEVATALAFGRTRLGIVPAGSGNGLARGLRIPTSSVQALDVAIGSHSRIIDLGEMDGRLFVNLAGIGLDAAIAHAFAVGGLKRRGFRRYVEIAMREVFTFRAPPLSITADGDTFEMRPLLLTVGNGTQYGGGAVIARDASFDDGKLDLVMATARPSILALLQAPALFLGGATYLPGVTRRLVAEMTVTAREPIHYHVDGEPFVGGTTIHARIHPHALTIAVPGGG